MDRVTRKVQERFENDDFKRWHYLFPGDYIKGSVKCEDECTVSIASYLSTCRKTWNKQLANVTDGGFIGMTSKKRSKNKCAYKTSYLFDEEGSGVFSFQAEILYEGPHYVSVTKGVFSSPTGSIDYSVSSTRINTTNYVKKCKNYECEFGNLTGRNRTDTYVVVNVFSESMKGEYEVRIQMRGSKETNNKVSIGFAITTGVFIVLFIIGAAMHWSEKVYDHCSSGSSSGSSQSNNNKNNNEMTISETPGKVQQEEAVEMS